mmetsp:Transcript_42975/g.129000  ORF Transcript_42975/g.129000 Transcript_42975/m.129000 type:complete len:297 (+) Transcript_42975:1227-2117(+)
MANVKETRRLWWKPRHHLAHDSILERVVKRATCISSFLAVLYFACASVRRDGGAFTCAQVVLVDSRLAFWQVGDEVEPARQVWHLALLLHFLPHCACLQLAPQRQIRHADGMPDDKRAQCEVVVDAIAHSFEIGAGNDVAVGVIEPVVDLCCAQRVGAVQRLFSSTRPCNIPQDERHAAELVPTGQCQSRHGILVALCIGLDVCGHSGQACRRHSAQRRGFFPKRQTRHRVSWQLDRWSCQDSCNRLHRRRAASAMAVSTAVGATAAALAAGSAAACTTSASAAGPGALHADANGG